MSNSVAFNYRNEANRYKYYYQRLQWLYQKPVTQVSSALLFTIGTIIFFAIFAIKPTLETISELLKTIADQKEVLQKAEQKAASLTTAQQQMDQIQQYQSSLEAAIPPKLYIQDIIKEIEALAALNNIPLQNLKISEFTYPEQKTEGIQEIDFSISIESDYKTGKKFLQDLEKLPRFISIKSANIQLLDNKNKSSSPGAIQFMVNCQAYRVANTL